MSFDTRSVRTLILVALATWLLPAVAFAQVEIAVNGQLAPGSVTVTAGATVSVAVSNGPGSTTDWVALSGSGTSDYSYIDWRYLNGATAPPATGLTSATITFTVPIAPGSYEFRLFANNTYSRLATSVTVNVVASPATLTVNGVDPPTAVSVAAGTRMTLDVAGGPANATDWVGLYAAGAGDGAYLTWRYLSGTTTPPASGLSSATLTFDAPTSPGSYEFRLFANNTYARLTASTTIVTAASTAQLAVNNVAPPAGVTVAAGSIAIVSVSGGPANAGDWVALYPSGAPNGGYLDWRYLSNTTSPPAAGLAAATLTFTMPVSSGVYEFRFFADNGYGELTASAPVTVVPSPAQLDVNGVSAPSTVPAQAGSRLSVHVTGGPANATDWVGLYSVGTGNGAYLSWRYLSGTTSPPAAGIATATLTFDAPTTAGNYEFRFFAANTYALLATSPTVIVDASSAQLAVDAVPPPSGVTVVAGSIASVAVSGGPGNVYDWVGLYAAGSPDGAYLDWRYLSNTTAPPSAPLTAATLTFLMPVTAGVYEFRLFADNGYGRLATSATVTVASTTACTYDVTPGSVTSAAGGTTGTLTITTSRPDCDWTASSDSSWATVSAASGTGTGALTYTIAANVAPARSATLTVAGHALAVSQESGCAFTVTSPNLTTGAIAPDLGGGVGIGLARRSNLPGVENFTYMGWWHIPDLAITDASFFFFGNVENPDPQPYISASLDYDGGTRHPLLELWNGETYDYLPGSDLVGTGWIHVAYVKSGNTHTLYFSDPVHDATADVSTTLDMSSAFAPTSLFTFVDVIDGTATAATGVKIWEAALTPAEIRAERDAGYAALRTANLYLNTPLAGASDLSDSSGNGHGWAVDAFEPGHLVTASGPFAYVHAHYTGAAGLFNVAASADSCQWTAVADAGWASLDPSAGAGSGAVAYAIAANPSSSSRTAALTIVGRTFSVEQDATGTCTYSLIPTAIASAGAGQTGWMAVDTIGANCAAAWTPETDANWVTLGPPIVDQWAGYVPRVLADAPVAYWTFDDAEGGGRTVQDLTGHGLSAALIGGTFVTDRGSLSLDGSNGFAIVGASPRFSLTRALSLELWLGTTSEQGRLVGTVSGAVALDMAAGGFVELRMLGQTLRSATAINDGEQHMVNATWTGSVAALYIDGVFDAQMPLVGTLPSSAGGVMMGADSTVSDFYAGLLDDVVVFDYALTPAQIADRFLWDNGEQSPTSGVFSYAVAANPSGTPRDAAISVADRSTVVTQGGATPAITSAAPASGAVGTQVSISGSGFGDAQGSATVWLGTKAGSVVTWSDTQIVAAVSTGAVSGTVQVRRDGAASNTLPFTVATPSVTGVTVSGDGTQVTIAGSGFGGSQGAGQVWLGTAAGVITSWSDTQIVATVAPGSNAGNVQVLQGGVWGNAIPFTPASVTPHIDFLTPNAGVPGTVVTIYGSGFGASRGSGVVSISGTSASITSWSDTLVSATVAAGTISGVLKIQQHDAWSNAVTFRVPSGSPTVTLAPNVLSLVVGDTRSIQSLDAIGARITGLAWASSDTGIVSLSTDDPPVLTAVAPGNASVTAGGASADVTVYAGPDLPTGTVLWSDPGDASGTTGMYIAVPNYDAVADVFATQYDGTVQAITSDGTVAWTSGPLPNANRSSYLPDFQGGLVVYDDRSIYRLDGLTGQPSPAYTAMTNEDQYWFNSLPPNIHPDGTIFTTEYACHDFCPNADDGEDGAWVVAIDPSTGASKFRVPLQNSVGIDTVSDETAAFCHISPGPEPWHYLSFPFAMSIAGDGYVYLSYQSIDSFGSVKKATQPYPDEAYDAWDRVLYDMGDQDRPADFNAAIADLEALWQAIGQAYDPGDALLQAFQRGDRNTAIFIENNRGPQFLRLCDRSESEVTKLHLLRVGPDGSSSDVVVDSWHESRSTVFTLSPTYPYYHETGTQTGPAYVDFGGAGSNIITNADQGALFSWNVSKQCYENSPQQDPRRPWVTFTQTDSSCHSGILENHLSTMTNGALASDVVWSPGITYGAPVQPVLQLEDGSFAGTASTDSGQMLMVFDTVGRIKWTLPAYYPVMVTPGGLIASGGAGTYAFDDSGASTGQVAEVPTYSWRKDSYALTSGGTTQVVEPNIKWGASYAAMSEANPSASGTFVGVVDSGQVLPSFGLPGRGGNCFLGSDKVDLIDPDRQFYEAMKQELLGSGALTSDQCKAYFNADTARARYTDLLTTAVTRQDPHDGPRSTLNKFDAGVMGASGLTSSAAANIASILRTVPVCSEFIPTIRPTSISVVTAVSQGVLAVRGANPVKDMYLNTDPFVSPLFTPATLLHEALHNLTGLDDQELALFVGPPAPGPGNPITRKLLQAGCAPR
ncbi:MAG: IPT/TIG domain-containing protein [Acidobacteriia bacterium]|nr:IPT/TIG domain-containing protein [Terriglobia bacterium]